MLQAIDLHKRYGELIALEQLNLTVGPGEICCLLGANGAGKTTTIHLFLDFVPRTSGRALICGHDVCEHPLETKALLAYIPEIVNLYPTLTGLENLQYFAALANLRRSTDELISGAAKVGLTAGQLRQRLGSFSKGMRQKLGLAIALARGAKVLLMDEPLSGLDPQAANEFSQTLREVSGNGVAVLMTTHDLFRAREVATHIGIMKRGRLIEYRAASSVAPNELESIYLEHMRKSA
jgi:ABC-2 type transport system ATP-binding protein